MDRVLNYLKIPFPAIGIGGGGGDNLMIVRLISTDPIRNVDWISLFHAVLVQLISLHHCSSDNPLANNYPLETNIYHARTIY